MFYVSSAKGNKFGVTDTGDGKEEFYSKEELLTFVNKQGVEINGVDNHDVCVVVLPKATLKLFKSYDFESALKSMVTDNTCFGIKLRSQPTGGEMHFVSNECINIRRVGVDKFHYDQGTMKTSRFDLTLDRMCGKMNSYRKWRVVDAQIGAY